MPSRLKLIKPVSQIFPVLYLIIGAALLFILIQSGFTLFYVGFLGTINLIAFYGMIRKENWAIYLVIGLSLTSTVFSCSTIYAVSRLPLAGGLVEPVFLLIMVLYAAFSVFSFFYAIIWKDKFR